MPSDKPTIEKLQPGDPDTQSADVVAENIARLKALFPELVTEGKDGSSVNVDVLKQLVGDATVTDCDEKFGLNWHGKRRARQLALTPSTGTLRPCPEESVNWDTTQNLFIEGDNLEVLKLLQKSYAGKVKLIYIDPPYNTGSDLIYPDSFAETLSTYLAYTGQVDSEGMKMSANVETSGRFHTAWMNMILPRLRQAQLLLRQDGICAVSIDERELGHLRVIMDELFGSENRLGCIAVVNNLKGRSDDAFFATSHEYLLVYAKSVDHASINGLPLPDAMVEEYDQEDEFGKYKLIPLKKTGKGWRREDRPNMHYPIYASEDGTVVQSTPFKDCVTILPMRGDEHGRWRWGPDTFAERYEKDVVVRRVRGGSLTAFSKMRLGENGEERTLTPKTTWLDSKFDSGAGGRDLAELGMSEAFSNPKPVEFLKEVIRVGADADSLILDFFGGSASTAHAAMSLNAEDGGHRRFVVVQLPEELEESSAVHRGAVRLCKEVGAPLRITEVAKQRLRRAQKALATKELKHAVDLGFRVFKLDSSNIREWEPSREGIAESLEAHVENLRTGRTEQDILYELLLKRGLDLCVPIETKEIAGKTVHSIGAGTLFACLSESITADEGEPLALGIVAWHQELDPAGDTTVVFRDSAFADDVVKTNVAAILDQSGLKNVRSL